MGELQPGTCSLLLLGEHVESEGATKDIRFGKPFGICESFEALVDLIAEADLKAGNVASAIRNLQMALTFEASNAGFKAMLEELRARQKAGG